jgi:ketosteroid isomerase-like protein
MSEPDQRRAPLSPREVAEQVRRMVAGERVVFADLFAADGVLAYPFAPPGRPAEIAGREAIRAYFAGREASRELFAVEGVEALVRETDDPEVVVTEITHHGWSYVTRAPYRFTALGVIRVHDGQIARYDDYMDPIALAMLLGRAADLAAALAGA